MLQITSAQARAAISAGEAKALELGVPVNISVLDAGAHLKAFTRMDGAVLGSIDLATRKARTAVLFQTTSEAVWEFAKPGAPAHALEISNGGLAPFPGGLSLRAPDGMVSVPWASPVAPFLRISQSPRRQPPRQSRLDVQLQPQPL